MTVYDLVEEANLELSSDNYDAYYMLETINGFLPEVHARYPAHVFKALQDELVDFEEMMDYN
ncbi:hypothetical protein [Bacillus sp. P14.5]|uniref:hypothetical protein n=1 Tax=Bacillus sp. P14.5 TaxID=1983400 RepID=UPI000DE8D040|nr:hypothetical protein [Bacillus sp. P14.5]